MDATEYSEAILQPLKDLRMAVVTLTIPNTLNVNHFVNAFKEMLKYIQKKKKLTDEKKKELKLLTFNIIFCSREYHQFICIDNLSIPKHESKYAVENLIEFSNEIHQYEHKHCQTCHQRWPEIKKKYNNPFKDLKEKNCESCFKHIRDFNNQTGPDKSSNNPFTKQNKMIPSPVPDCLKNLSFTEKLLIAKVNPVLSIYKMPTNKQTKFTGHIINISQDITEIAHTLPRLPSEVDTLIIRKQGLKKGELKVSEFGVNRFKVEEALEYLKENNFYYQNIRIDKDRLRELKDFDPSTDLKELVLQKQENEEKPKTKEKEEKTKEKQEKTKENENEQKENQETSDIDSDTDSKNKIPEHQKQPSHTGVLINPNQKQEKDKITDFLELKDINHTTTKKMNYPAQGEAINEFNCQGLLTMAFPYLFPDGLGDPTVKTRDVNVNFSEWCSSPAQVRRKRQRYQQVCV